MNEKRNKKTSLYAVLLAAMLLAMPFLIPSGAVTLAADRAYTDNMPLFEDGGEEEFFEGDVPVEEPTGDAPESGLLHISESGGSAQASVAALPVDFTPGLIPNPAGFTQTSYQDESISVNLESREVGDSMFHVAHVKIAHPSQLRTALAGPYGTKKTNKTSAMAKANNAVVAMNGDYYSNREGGYIARQGEAFRKKPSRNLDMLVIDSKGDFHVLVQSDPEKLTALVKDQENPIVQAFTFGPALIVDSAVLPLPESYPFNIRRPEPRAAIGQVGPLEYVMVVVDGRRDDSPGVTMEDLAAFMAELGCTQAFNLDGGNSATMIFNNAYYSRKTDNSERSVSDIIYFASAVDPATWQK
jgi:exopolysaccharide biosynthesis protein